MEQNLTFLDIKDYSKESISNTVKEIEQKINNEGNALKAYISLKYLESLVKDCIDKVKEHALNKIPLTGKETISGVKITTRGGKDEITFDFHFDEELNLIDKELEYAQSMVESFKNSCKKLEESRQARIVILKNSLTKENEKYYYPNKSTGEEFLVEYKKGVTPLVLVVTLPENSILIK